MTSGSVRPTATLERRYTSAFVLDEKRLRHIVSILTHIDAQIEYEVWFSNGLLVSYGTLDELVALNNTGERKIRSIKFKGGQYREDLFEVVASSEGPFYTLKYRLYGDENVLVERDRLIKEWVHAITPWYSSLTTATGVVATAAVAGTILFFLGFDLFRHVFSFRFGSMAVGLVLGVIAASAMPLLFPKVVFALGYGLDRARQRDNVRQIILVTVLLSGLLVRGCYDFAKRRAAPSPSATPPPSATPSATATP